MLFSKIDILDYDAEVDYDAAEDSEAKENQGTVPGDKRHVTFTGDDLLQMSKEDWITKRYNFLDLPMPDKILFDIPGY